MSNNIAVNFKVSGGELASYLDSIQKKSEALTNTAIRGAMEETKAAKEQLRIINETISAIEKKNKLEGQATRDLMIGSRDMRLSTIKEEYEEKRKNLLSQYGNTPSGATRLKSLDDEERRQITDTKKSFAEQIAIQKEQEKQQKLAVQVSRESIKEAKIAAEEQRREIRKGNTTLEAVRDVAENGSDEAKLTANILEEQLTEDKKQEEKQKKREAKENEKDNLFSTFLKADIIKSAGNMIGQIPNAKNELDFVKPMTSLLAMGIGGALGSAIDLVTGSKILGTGVGQTQAGVIGAEMGKVVGDFIGSSLERSYKGREDLTNKNFLLQATTGRNFGVDAFGVSGLGATGKSSITGNLSRYGADYGQTADLQYQLAQKQGFARNLQGGAENVIALEKGLGVNREAVFQIVDLQRSSSKENRDFLRTISGVLNAGKNGIFKEDRTFLSEFLGRFSNLQRELLKTQGHVGTGTTMDLLSRFDSIGGQFSVRDPRSAGLMSSLNNSLINPNTEFKKALSYYVLRQHMGANANIADVIQEQQKGAASPFLMQGMMNLYSTMGGDSEQRLAFADFFDGNVDAGTKALRAFKSGKLKNGSMFGKEVSGGMGEGDIRSLAESQVGKYSKSSAEIQNMFIDNVAQAVSGVGEKMKDLFGSMLDELEDYIVTKLKGGTTTNSKIYENNKAKPNGVNYNKVMLKSYGLSTGN